jgi:signal transduction histidine kinase
MHIFYLKNKVANAVERFCYIAYFALITLLFLIVRIPIILLAANVMMIFLISLIYVGNLKKSAIVTIVIVLSLLCIETLLVYLTSLINLNPLKFSEYNSIFGVIVMRIIMLAFIQVLHGYNNVKSEISLPNHYWFSIIAIPVCSIIMLSAVFSINSISEEVIITCMVSTLIISLVTFFIYDSILSLMQDGMRKRLLTEQIKYYKQQLNTMASALDNYKTIRHDIKNRLTPIYSLISNGRTENLQKYISELKDAISQSTVYANCGNVAIDSIINFKLNEKKDIVSTVQISIPKDLVVSTQDLSVILGNMIDNALEAVEKIEDKKITIRVNFSKGILIIEVINNYDGCYNKTSNRFVSLKPDKEIHGIGLKSIEDTIEKYNGIMKITHDENQFKTKVLMYVEPNLWKVVSCED